MHCYGSRLNVFNPELFALRFISAFGKSDGGVAPDDDVDRDGLSTPVVYADGVYTGSRCSMTREISAPGNS
jgi:hypothetical protein